MKKYSKDKRVVFDEESHSYFLGDKKLKSVTQYISEFKPFFNKHEISKAYALKHGLNQEDVLLDWDKKAKESAQMGTYIHNIFEDYILGGEIETKKDYMKCNVALKIIEDYFTSNRLIPVETEYIVYDDNLAGQVDCIAKDIEGNYYILDWKTNKEIKTSNKWQKMLGEYSYLDDCSFNHYSIQLRTYQNMCKEYEIKDCFIVHLMEEDYKFIRAKEI